jgi:hypothetical protein
MIGESNLRNDMPLSELYRIAAEKWVDLDHAARLLEDTKSSILAQWMADHGDIPISRAEAKVKSSDDWLRLVEDTVTARTKANKAKIELEYLRMRFSEEVSREATARVERKVG